MRRTAALLFALVAAPASAGEGEPGSPWRTLEPGLELAELPAPRKAEIGDSIIRVLRIDPERFELRLLNSARTSDGRLRTAREWVRSRDLVAAINASLYQTDYRSSVSLMRDGSYVNNSHLSKDNTVLAFGPREPGLPPVQIIDRTCQDFDDLRERYRVLVQSIRMISCEGRNVWAQQPKRWSTAAVGIDTAGRVLLIHCRSPYSVHDLIDMLLTLPVSLRSAMYVEGGPEAQLAIRSGDEDLEFFGSFETGLFETDANLQAWPIPNAIGVARKAP